jgi:hypothetical protein
MFNQPQGQASPGVVQFFQSEPQRLAVPASSRKRVRQAIADAQVALLQEQASAAFTRRTINHIYELDREAQAIAPQMSPLGQALVAQEMVAFSFHARNIQSGMFDRWQ